MAKNSIRDYSATNSDNTDIQSIDIGEGCSPAGINNAIREVMADLKDVSTGAVALESPKFDSILDGNIKATDASGTDAAGTATTIKGGAGTGTGAGGSIAFQVADGAGSTGSSVNAHATAMTIADDGNVSIDNDLTVDTNTLYVDSTNNRVGINNASPTTALEVDSDGATTAIFDRATDDGDVVEIKSSGTTIGAIGTNGTNAYITFRTEAAGDGCGFRGSGSLTGAIIPVDGNGSPADDHIYLGASSTRWDAIYAANGTIQTSDANEKQQIAALTDAEITAAKAISALFKTFKWNNAVETKGDAARTHTGVIAQDIEAAMTAAGLDAGDYAFFISDTWTNDDGNSQTRKGIRYAELLAFIGAANEQRLTDIETRIAALENL